MIEINIYSSTKLHILSLGELRQLRKLACLIANAQDRCMHDRWNRTMEYCVPDASVRDIQATKGVRSNGMQNVNKEFVSMVNKAK